jgi:hypothetical protein
MKMQQTVCIAAMMCCSLGYGKLTDDYGDCHNPNLGWKGFLDSAGNSCCDAGCYDAALAHGLTESKYWIDATTTGGLNNDGQPCDTPQDGYFPIKKDNNQCVDCSNCVRGWQ